MCLVLYIYTINYKSHCNIKIIFIIEFCDPDIFTYNKILILLIYHVHYIFIMYQNNEKIIFKIIFLFSYRMSATDTLYIINSQINHCN